MPPGRPGPGLYPRGDWEIPLPLTATRLTSEELEYDEMHDATDTVTARTWVDAFDISVASGLVRDGWERVIGLLLRNDFAPALRNSPPHAGRDSVSEPDDLAHMEPCAAT
ncbi:hypothetical protein ACFYPA_00115 [Streptomyces sp. NPDC005775]|uniref:hypothetical protein n=1 Tax=unclassified Streptomyces TaxID=2593676 RepID=UPI0033E42782